MEWSDPRALAVSQTVRGVVSEVVARKLHLFEHFPDLDELTLVDRVLDQVLKAWGGYNPAKAKPSTFAYRVAEFRLLDIWRSRVRLANREAAVAVHEWQTAGDTAGLPGGDGGNEETLEEWAGHLYRHAVRMFPDVKRPGRNGTSYRYAQCVVAVLLARKMKLTTRGLVIMLLNNEDLRRAIGLTRRPSKMWLTRARSVALSLGIPEEGLFAGNE